MRRCLEQLTIANECLAAAELDLADAEHFLAVAKRKQEAMDSVAKEAGDKLSTLVNQYVAAPILMIDHDSE